MQVHIVGDPEHIPDGLQCKTSTISSTLLTDMRYMLYYHDECNGVIVTDSGATTLIDRARICKTTPVLAIGNGLLSCARVPGPVPSDSQTVVLRTDSRPQGWFKGAKTVERTLVATIDGEHAAANRLPISGMTVAGHAAIYDPEFHPFLVGVGWRPEVDDPIWLAFLRAVKENYYV